MRLQWIEDILAVAETGSLAAAAERRRLSQSAFSRRIQKVEDFVGVELLDRSRKPIQLKPTTAEQREQLVRLAGDLRQLVADLRRGERTAKNRLVIASQHALTTAFTPGLIRRLEAKGLEIHIRLRSANLDDCIALLLARHAEIALVYRLAGGANPIDADYIEATTIGRDRLVPVFGTAAGAAGLAGPSLRYIAYPKEVYLGRLLESHVLPRVQPRWSPVPRVETALTPAALELAVNGIGVAWVPLSLAEARIADGTVLDLAARLPSLDLDIVALRLVGAAAPAESAVWRELPGPAPPAAERAAAARPG